MYFLTLCRSRVTELLQWCQAMGIAEPTYNTNRQPDGRVSRTLPLVVVISIMSLMGCNIDFKCGMHVILDVLQQLGEW